jgi:polysaccharide export outer membrane protein
MLSTRAPASSIARWACWLSLAGALGGCALAPGHNMGANVGNLPVTPGNDAPPEGALTRITPELIRAQRAVPQPDPSPDLKPFLVEAPAYRIGAGDVIGITVWGNPDFSAPTGTVNNAGTGGSGVSGFTVSARGTIQLPFIGNVKAAGLTEDELRDSVTTALRTQIRNPQVTIEIKAYRSARIFVDGEVNKPGQQVINDVPMTLPEVLERAGGLTKAADRSAVSITRGVKTVRFNLDQLTARGIDPQRIVLAKGDTLRVDSLDETRVYVLGEVSGPGVRPLRKGKLSLLEALGDSGGVSSASGDTRQIFVVRGTDPTRPTIFHIDVTSPIFLALADGFELKPRDVVYVDPVPLVRWNRVLNLVLPAASSVQTVSNIRDLTR